MARSTIKFDPIECLQGYVLIVMGENFPFSENFRVFNQLTPGPSSTAFSGALTSC